MSKDFVFIENGLVKYEDYSRLIDKCEKALKDNRIKDKEIKRLTELCNKYEEEHKTTFEKWKIDIERIARAIEYINDIQNSDYVDLRITIKELLEILKGSDKE